MFKVENNNIYLIRGDTGVFDISIQAGDGNDVTLLDTDVLTFTIRKNSMTPRIVLQKVLKSTALQIAPEDTESLAFGQYVYDVELRRADGYVDTIIPPHSFTLMEEVTY